MSAEEEDLIIGRLVRARKDAERDVSLLRAKLKEFESICGKVALVIKDSYRTDNRVTADDILGTIPAYSTVDSLPSASEIRDTIGQLRTASGRLEVASAQLATLGF